MQEEVLNLFGSLLMKRVRDWSIQDIDMLVSGQAKGLTAERFQNLFAQPNDNCKALIQQVTPDIVDFTIHNLLWMLEQEGEIEVFVRLKSGEFLNLKDASDGLTGENYEWIRQFSQERYTD